MEGPVHVWIIRTRLRHRCHFCQPRASMHVKTRDHLPSIYDSSRITTRSLTIDATSRHEETHRTYLQYVINLTCSWMPLLVAYSQFTLFPSFKPSYKQGSFGTGMALLTWLLDTLPDKDLEIRQNILLMKKELRKIIKKIMLSFTQNQPIRPLIVKKNIQNCKLFRSISVALRRPFLFRL